MQPRLHDCEVPNPLCLSPFFLIRDQTLLTILHPRKCNLTARCYREYEWSLFSRVKGRWNHLIHSCGHLAQLLYVKARSESIVCQTSQQTIAARYSKAKLHLATNGIVSHSSPCLSFWILVVYSSFLPQSVTSVYTDPFYCESVCCCCFA